MILINYIQNRSSYRNLVVGVDTQVPLINGSLVTGINFDNAATTPPFVSVLKEINNFSPWYSSIHRGTGYKSLLSSEMYEEARMIIKSFVKADYNKDTVIFIKNTTEAINKLSYRLCEEDKKCVVLSTFMEHHSNDLPWRNKYHVDYIETDKCGRLSIQDLEAKLIKYKGNVKLVTITGASNVTGYVNSIHSIAELAHKYNAKILVDGAQLVPHAPVDMKPLNSPEHIDYLTFSAHKMYAPFGIGVLIGPKKTFEKGDPDYVGGGTVKTVTHDYVIWDDPPHKEEAGSPNIIGVVALIKSIQTLTMLGMDNIDIYEKSLATYTVKGLRLIKDVEVYCGTDDDLPRIGVVPFNIKGVSHDVVAKALSFEAGIAVRNGCFCAQPYIQKLLNIDPEEMKLYKENPDQPRPGMVRISFGIYNDYNEIDLLLRTIEQIVQNKKYYNLRYSTQKQL